MLNPAMKPAGASSAPPPPMPGMPGMGGMPDMATIMKYLPQLLAFLSAIPGVLLGFSITVLYFFVVVGPFRFGDTIAPLAGFHLLFLFLYREVHETLRFSLCALQQVQVEKVDHESLAKDIAMQFNVKLD